MAIEVEIETGGSFQNLQEILDAIKSIKAQLRADGIGEEEFDRLTQQLGQARKAFKDFQDDVKTNAAGSGFEKMSRQIGEVQDNLSNLNFKDAAGDLTNLSRTIKGFSFSSFTSGVNAAARGVLDLGKAILLNPMTSWVLVIGTAVAALGALLVSTGGLETILNSLKSVLDPLINAFKRFTDALGITTYAMDELASNIAYNVSIINVQLEKGLKDAQQAATIALIQEQSKLKILRETGATQAQIFAQERVVLNKKVDLYNATYKLLENAVTGFDDELTKLEETAERQLAQTLPIGNARFIELKNTIGLYNKEVARFISQGKDVPETLLEKLKQANSDLEAYMNQYPEQFEKAKVDFNKFLNFSEAQVKADADFKRLSKSLQDELLNLLQVMRQVKDQQGALEVEKARNNAEQNEIEASNNQKNLENFEKVTEKRKELLKNLTAEEAFYTESVRSTSKKRLNYITTENDNVKKATNEHIKFLDEKDDVVKKAAEKLKDSQVAVMNSIDGVKKKEKELIDALKEEMGVRKKNGENAEVLDKEQAERTTKIEEASKNLVNALKQDAEVLESEFFKTQLEFYDKRIEQVGTGLKALYAQLEQFSGEDEKSTKDLFDKKLQAAREYYAKLMQQEENLERARRGKQVAQMVQALEDIRGAFTEDMMTGNAKISDFLVPPTPAEIEAAKKSVEKLGTVIPEVLKNLNKKLETDPSLQPTLQPILDSFKKMGEKVQPLIEKFIKDPSQVTFQELRQLSTAAANFLTTDAGNQVDKFIAELGIKYGETGTAMKGYQDKLNKELDLMSSLNKARFEETLRGFGVIIDSELNNLDVTGLKSWWQSLVQTTRDSIAKMKADEEAYYKFKQDEIAVQMKQDAIDNVNRRKAQGEEIVDIEKATQEELEKLAKDPLYQGIKEAEYQKHIARLLLITKSGAQQLREAYIQVFASMARDLLQVADNFNNFNQAQAELAQMKTEQAVYDQQQSELKALDERTQAQYDAANGSQEAITQITEVSSREREGIERKYQKIQEEQAARAFERNKEFAIASAIITGLNGVVNAISAPSLLPDPLNWIVKTANAAMVASLTSINVQKIKATKYRGSGSMAPTAPAANSAAGGGGMVGGQPNFSFFGNNNTGNELGATGGRQGAPNTNITVDVNISESEITSTQQRVARLTSAAEL